MHTTPKKRGRAILHSTVMVVVLYAGVAWTVFAFRHPEMTETQCFLHFWDALLFRQ